MILKGEVTFYCGIGSDRVGSCLTSAHPTRQSGKRKEVIQDAEALSNIRSNQISSCSWYNDNSRLVLTQTRCVTLSATLAASLSTHLSALCHDVRQATGYATRDAARRISGAVGSVNFNGTGVVLSSSCAGSPINNLELPGLLLSVQVSTYRVARRSEQTGPGLIRKLLILQKLSDSGALLLCLLHQLLMRHPLPRWPSLQKAAFLAQKPLDGHLLMASVFPETRLALPNGIVINPTTMRKLRTSLALISGLGGLACHQDFRVQARTLRLQHCCSFLGVRLLGV